MKQLSSVLNGVLLVAVIVLFGLHFSSNKPSQEKVCVASDSTMVVSGDFGIAYVSLDSLLLNYEYAKKLSEEMINKEETSRADLNQKAKVFQQDVTEFQRKLQNNGFLSRDRAENEQERLAKAERALQELNQKLTNDLMKLQDQTNRTLRDSIVNYMEEYGKTKPYKLILSNMAGDNVLYSVEGTNITKEIINGLNERYSKTNQ